MTFRPCFVQLGVSPLRSLRLSQTYDGYALRTTLFSRRYSATSSKSGSARLQKSERLQAIEYIDANREPLLQDVEREDVHRLSKRLYKTLALIKPLRPSARKKVTSRHLCFTREQIHEMLILLSKAENGKYAQLAHRLVQIGTFGSEVDGKILQYILEAYLQTSQPSASITVLASFQRHPAYSTKVNPEHWTLLMKSFSESKNLKLMWKCIARMELAGVHPNVQHYGLILEAMLSESSPPPVKDVRAILKKLFAKNLLLSSYIRKVLMRAEQRWVELQGITLEYMSGPQGVTKERERERGRGRIRVRARVYTSSLVRALDNGRDAFEKVLSRAISEGFVPNSKTLVSILDLTSASTLEELYYFEQALGFRANLYAWPLLIKNAVAKAGALKGIELYNVAKERGFPPSAIFLHTIIRALCSPSPKDPPVELVNLAVDLYYELYPKMQEGPLADYFEWLTNVKVDSYLKLTEDPLVASERLLCNALVRVLIWQSNAKKFIPIAFDILRNMHARKMGRDVMTATSIAVLLIRTAETHDQALIEYERIRKWDGVPWDSMSYAAILHAFSYIVDDSSFPPASSYLRILQDMQESGIERTVEVYALLLKRYGELATIACKLMEDENRENVLERIQDVIKQTHTLIAQDMSLNPDIKVWGRLMDAYGRARSLEGVLQVWDFLHSAGKASGASVSIVLDACGFSGDAARAKSIVESLRESEFRLNMNNWNAYVECLCRTGELEAAIDVVCHDMPTAGVQPTRMTILVLLSFAMRYGKRKEVQLTLRRYYPHGLENVLYY